MKLTRADLTDSTTGVYCGQTARVGGRVTMGTVTTMEQRDTVIIDVHHITSLPLTSAQMPTTNNHFRLADLNSAH